MLQAQQQTIPFLQEKNLLKILKHVAIPAAMRDLFSRSHTKSRLILSSRMTSKGTIVRIYNDLDPAGRGGGGKKVIKTYPLYPVRDSKKRNNASPNMTKFI